MKALRPLGTLAGLLAAWQALVWLAAPPPYLLPGPLAVAAAWAGAAGLLLRNAAITLVEILAGLAAGIALGCGSALAISYWRAARRWLTPLLVASQAIPVFALAPLLVLWLGYGLPSKIAMAALVIYFPVTAAFIDGLRRSEPGWLDLAATMGASRWAVLRQVRLPAALPGLASGIRIAAAVAPIGAVIGEWVGSGAGLGYLMLQANARMQIALMFAALLTLGAMAVALYFAVDAALRRALPWQPETLPDSTE